MYILLMDRACIGARSLVPTALIGSDTAPVLNFYTRAWGGVESKISLAKWVTATEVQTVSFFSVCVCFVFKITFFGIKFGNWLLSIHYFSLALPFYSTN